jgi:hypothetical protein
MINSIIEAISIALNAEFGDDYTTYTEEQEQGLKEPCFFISTLEPTRNLFRDRRYFRRQQFCIQFFPADRDRAQAECNDTAERLEECLETITVDGDLMRGDKMNHKIVDDVLNFFVNYDCFVIKKYDSEPMETLEIKGAVNNGG